MGHHIVINPCYLKRRSCLTEKKSANHEELLRCFLSIPVVRPENHLVRYFTNIWPHYITKTVNYPATAMFGGYTTMDPWNILEYKLHDSWIEKVLDCSFEKPPDGGPKAFLCSKLSVLRSHTCCASWSKSRARSGIQLTAAPPTPWHIEPLSMAIPGSDWLEVPIPYMFGLFVRPMFAGISPEFIWPNIWYVYVPPSCWILEFSHWLYTND